MPAEIPLRWTIVRRVALMGAVFFTFLTVLGIVALVESGDTTVLLVFYALAACLGWVIERRISDPPSRILIRSGLRWAALLGPPAFVVGFVGPLILMPEAIIGPLLGIFLTGPLGAFLGVVVGVVKSWPAYRTARRNADRTAA